MDKLKSQDILLTTRDNEFNPFDDYDNWQAFDTDAYSSTHPAYCTEAYVMRVLGFRNPLDYSPDAISEELMQVYEEIITINNEMGIDVYQIITPTGERFDHVPPYLLYADHKTYEPTRGGGPQNTPTP